MSGMRFFEGKAPSIDEKPPLHWGQRMVATTAYGREIANGATDEDAKKAAFGEARLWRMARIALGMPDDRPTKGEAEGGGFAIKWPFAMSEAEREQAE